VVYSEMNDLENLVALCHRCHMKFEGMWTESDANEFVERAQAHIR